MNTSSGEWFDDLQAQVVEEGAAVPLGATNTTTQTLKEHHPEQHSISGSRYDEYLFDQAKGSVDALSSTLFTAHQAYMQTHELASDLLRTFYQLEPQEQACDAKYQRNATAIHDMLGTTDYKRLHSLTQLDEFAAALATATMTEALVEVLAKQEREDKQKERQENKEKKPHQKKAKGEGQPGDQPGAQSSDDGHSPSGQPGNTPSGTQIPDDSGQEAQETLRGMQRRVAARKAAQQAEETIAEAQEALAAFGGEPDAIGGGWGTESGKAQLAGDVRARARLAMMILRNETLRRIAQLCGRMKKIAAQVERKRLTLGNTELYGVTLGNEVLNLLPSELALLGHPKLRRLFFAKYVDRTLNQYERYTPEPVGRGPIVVSVDESGSMSGQKNEWAKAVVLALLSIAAKQGRDLRVIHYASSRHSLLVEDYPKGKGSTEQVMKTALHFFGGGTSYEPWMQEALKAVQTSEYDRADIVALTDGECAVPDALLKEWQATKAVRGFRSVGILTGAPRGGAILRQFCDEVNHLKAVGEDETLLEQLFTLTV